jgi:ParB-like chromosome segregation protein Spo0J
MQLGQGESASDLFAAHNDAKFVIVDGFHRYTIMKRYPDIYAKNHGLLPVVVIDKPLNDRMASTVRHNRARGKHSIQGMGNLVMQMLSNGWRDSRICGELGLEKEELARLKHITGYAKMFKDAQYSRARETPRQIEVRLKGEA